MKQKEHYILIVLALVCQLTLAQVGIGTTNPDPSSILELNTNNSGFLVPRLTSTEKLNISNPATGLMVYDLTDKTYSFYDGLSWDNILKNSQLPSDLFQGYHETGTRAGGDLIVSIGDFDSSYTNFKAIIDIDQELFYSNFTVGGSLGVGNYQLGNIGRINNNNLTQNRSYELPNENGTIALKENQNLQSISDIGNSTTNELELNGGINLNGSTITLSDIYGDVQFISSASGNIEIGSDAYGVNITADSGLTVDNGIVSQSTFVSESSSILKGQTLIFDPSTNPYPTYNQKVEVYDGNILIEDGHLIMKDKVNGNHYKIEMINGVLTTTQVTL